MCGIAGYQGNKPNNLIVAMADAIGHRGPDNQSTILLDNCRTSLAHARLSIIDLSELSNQPLWDVAHTYCIVFNGEIYNYLELRDHLISKGYSFSSSGDAEVLLNLFIDQGKKALNHINGIFSFAIWCDEDKSLFIARDQLGVKPLYYAIPETGFIFSSELKSLLHDTSISRELDRTAISHYLRYLWCPSPMTPLKSVRKLEPGHFLEVLNGKIIRKEQYYTLPQHESIQCSLNQCKSVLLDTLTQSVERQLIADVKVGAFLSGGLDSSSIVAIAAKRLGAKNLPCYTIEFDGAAEEGMQEDLPYAKRVAQHIGVPLEIVKVSPDIVNDLPKLIYQLDEPQADVAPLNAWYISKLASEQGVKVLLSGAGGDDLLTGYRRHYALLNEKYWSWMPKSVRAGMKYGSGLLPKQIHLLRRIAKAFEYCDLDMNKRLPTYFHWLNSSKVNDLFKVPLVNITDPLIEHVDALPDSMSALQKMLQLDTKYFLVDHNLNYTDKVSMAEGIEVRVPLVDMAMVDVAASIPDMYKQHGRHGKWIFKKAMEGLLPNDIIYRPKTGFGAPVRPWIRNDLQPMVDTILSEASIKERGLFDHAKVRELIESDRVGCIDAAYTVLSLMSIELWCRQFVDPAVPTPMTQW
ncbi:MAG: asparagine synthase (glutamine-hydrolyzing) [Gammaproteobacteria bacterium]|nr:asparagine synthase (glutamine-hydrolyzing) [Gammaproteobacteria bacterium]